MSTHNLLRFKKIVQDCGGNLDKLKTHGFIKKKLPFGVSSCDFIYVSEKDKVVIKNSYLTIPNKPTGELKKVIIPTVFIPVNARKEWGYPYVLIQPLADTDSINIESRACKKLVRKFEGISDIKADNLARYKGKIKLIDW